MKLSQFIFRGLVFIRGTIKLKNKVRVYIFRFYVVIFFIWSALGFFDIRPKSLIVKAVFNFFFPNFAKDTVLPNLFVSYGGFSTISTNLSQAMLFPYQMYLIGLLVIVAPIFLLWSKTRWWGGIFLAIVAAILGQISIYQYFQYRWVSWVTLAYGLGLFFGWWLERPEKNFQLRLHRAEIYGVHCAFSAYGFSYASMALSRILLKGWDWASRGGLQILSLQSQIFFDNKMTPVFSPHYIASIFSSPSFFSQFALTSVLVIEFFAIFYSISGRWVHIFGLFLSLMHILIFCMLGLYVPTPLTLYFVFAVSLPITFLTLKRPREFRHSPGFCGFIIAACLLAVAWVFPIDKNGSMGNSQIFPFTRFALFIRAPLTYTWFEFKAIDGLSNLTDEVLWPTRLSWYGINSTVLYQLSKKNEVESVAVEICDLLKVDWKSTGKVMPEFRICAKQGSYSKDLDQVFHSEKCINICRQTL